MGIYYLLKLSKRTHTVVLHFITGVMVLVVLLLLKHKLSLTCQVTTFSNNTKYILFWPSLNGNDTQIGFYGDKYAPFKKCGFKNCYVTRDRKLLPIQKFDAIIFDGAEYDAFHKTPRARHSNQKYIFANLESPGNTFPSDLNLYKSFYNWTMTYRFDSDIVMRYGYIIKNKTGYVMPTEETLNKKSRTAAWILATKCYTPNKRELLYENLRCYLDAHMYGHCGDAECPRSMINVELPISHCYDLVFRKYKFYFVFEYTHCKDYVTEKLYKILEKDIVPIAFGAADYEEITPPHSVIVADKFSSVKELADYINFLDTNITEYLKFFEWKKHYSIERSMYRSACKLCEMLNDPSQPKKVYTDINSWWFGENNSYCKHLHELSKLTQPIME